MATVKIGLGGGCHWCTEAVFQALKGVTKVEQGYIQSNPPSDAFSEAIILHFQPEEISLNDLISVHLYTHQSTKNHSFRKKYRSAIYVTSEKQKEEATYILKELELELSQIFITQVLPLIAFKASRQEIQDYYLKDPHRPFCTRYIHPKIALLRNKFINLLKDSAEL